MKKFTFLLLIILTVSCQVTETIHLNSDGSGTIEVEYLRNENSYLQIAGENYSKEDVYKDTTYIFGDYIKKHKETFARTPVADRNVFLRYSGVKVHSKASSYDKEFRSIYAQNFLNASDIVDLYKTYHYLDDIKNNYALSAEEHYYKIHYDFTNNRFSRIVTIIDSLQLKNEIEKIEKIKAKYKGYKLVQEYTLNYHFPRKIQSVTNPLAKISKDRKSLTLELLLSDCLQNPLITNLEVVLEPDAVD